MNEREHTLEILAITRAVPFSYDHDSRKFLFGTEGVGISSVPEYGSLHSEGVGLTREAIEISASSAAFLHGVRNPVQTMFGKEFIREGWNNGLENEVDEVMADVMIELNEHYSPSDKAPMIGRSFHTHVHRDEGTVILRTAGICACTGPDRTVHDWDAVGFIDYTPHNVDSAAARASLLAGIGHIARRAQEWATD